MTSKLGSIGPKIRIYNTSNYRYNLCVYHVNDVFSLIMIKNIILFRITQLIALISVENLKTYIIIYNLC